MEIAGPQLPPVDGPFLRMLKPTVTHSETEPGPPFCIESVLRLEIHPDSKNIFALKNYVVSFSTPSLSLLVKPGSPLSLLSHHRAPKRPSTLIVRWESPSYYKRDGIPFYYRLNVSSHDSVCTTMTSPSPNVA